MSFIKTFHYHFSVASIPLFTIIFDCRRLPVPSITPVPPSLSPTPPAVHRIEIPVVQDFTITQKKSDSNYPFSLAAHPYIDQQNSEQIIFLLFPLINDQGEALIPANKSIYQVSLVLDIIAGYSTKADQNIYIQLFTTNQEFSQENTNWNNMPTLDQAIFTAKINATQKGISLFDIQQAVVQALKNKQNFVGIAIRIPPFSQGYIQFADKDNQPQEYYSPKLTVFYTDKPFNNITADPQDPPYDIQAYFDYLTRQAVISWSLNAPKKTLINNSQLNLQQSILYSNTFSDALAYPYFLKHPKSKLSYKLNTCKDLSQSTDCLSPSSSVQSPSIKCPQCSTLPSVLPSLSPTSTSVPSNTTVSPTIEPQYKQIIQSLEERLNQQQTKIEKIQQTVQQQQTLLDKLYLLLEKIRNFLSRFPSPFK